MAICPNVTEKISNQTNLLASLSTLNANFSALQEVVCGLYHIYPIGAIVFNSSTTYIPAGWIECNGQYIDGAVYTTLGELISGIYGPTSGSFFALPDCRARNIIQAGTGSGLTTRTFTNSGGAESVILTDAQMGTHTHTVTGDHTHTAYATHTHSVHDPNHIHDIDDPGHTHFVYYGISPDTVQAQFLSAGYDTGLTTTTNDPSALYPTPEQEAWGEAQALSATSVYQDIQTVGAFTVASSPYSTVPDKFWLQDFDNGGPELMFGSTPLSYWITPVDSKTTATPLQVTVLEALNIDADVTSQTLGIAFTDMSTFSVSVLSSSTVTSLTSSVGAGQAHENMSPFLNQVPIIRAI